MLRVPPLRRCQRLTSRGAIGRAGHLKGAIPCYRVSTAVSLRGQVDLLDRGSAGSVNQYFSIHAACVRNASLDINRHIATGGGRFNVAPTDFRFNLYQTQTHNQNANCFTSIRGHSCFVSAPKKVIFWTATIFVQVWTAWQKERSFRGKSERRSRKPSDWFLL
jgi:hypothetical protein